jgi:hypothetical protein
MEIVGQATTLDRIHSWIVAHDESRLFMVAYIGLALVLTIWIGLFWLVALVAVHLLFEYFRCRHDGIAGLRALGAAAWGVSLDIALVLFALVLAVYLQVVFGLLGLHALGRAGTAMQVGVRGGVRLASWEKVIRGVLLSLDDAFQGARAVLAMKSKGGAGELDAVAPTRAESPAAVSIERAPRASGWSRGDLLATSLAAVCIALILIAPIITENSWNDVLSIISLELRPFPSR